MAKAYNSYHAHALAVALAASQCVISAQLTDCLANIARHEPCADTVRDATSASLIAERAHILQCWLEHSAMSFERRASA